MNTRDTVIIPFASISALAQAIKASTMVLKDELSDQEKVQYMILTRAWLLYYCNLAGQLGVSVGVR